MKLPTLAELRASNPWQALADACKARMRKAVAKAVRLSQQDGRVRMVISTGPNATKITLRRPTDVDVIATNGQETGTWHVGKPTMESYIQW